MRLEGEHGDRKIREGARYRRRPAARVGLCVALRPDHVEVGEFLAGLHVLVAGGRRLHAVRHLLRGRRPADVVDLHLASAWASCMVCLVFGEIVSQFPISGGMYPWARRLVGKRWAWMAGWIYGWALCCTMAAVATGVAPFLAQLFGVDSTPPARPRLRWRSIAVTTLLNLSGTRLLARVAMFGFICELVGAIVVGGYLLLFARHQPLNVLIDTHHRARRRQLPAGFSRLLPRRRCSATTASRPAATWPRRRPMPSRTIPKAMRMTIYVGGAAASVVCLAFVLVDPGHGCRDRRARTRIRSSTCCAQPWARRVSRPSSRWCWCRSCRAC